MQGVCAPQVSVSVLQEMVELSDREVEPVGVATTSTRYGNSRRGTNGEIGVRTATLYKEVCEPVCMPAWLVTCGAVRILQTGCAHSHPGQWYGAPSWRIHDWLASCVVWHVVSSHAAGTKPRDPCHAARVCSRLSSIHLCECVD